MMFQLLATASVSSVLAASRFSIARAEESVTHREKITVRRSARRCRTLHSKGRVLIASGCLLFLLRTQFDTLGS
jgi:hypothetical protein